MPIQLAMPALCNTDDVFPRIPSDEDFVYVSAEEKSGDMILVSPSGRRQDVQVKIYRTTLEHFAVVYPQKRICKPIGVINLKNTSCQKIASPPGVLLRQEVFDSTACLKFYCSEPEDVESWMSAFSKSRMTFIRQSSLPVVEEDEEF